MSLCPPVRRTFSDERGPGTFHSLGVLPKTRRDDCPRKSPVFHIHHDDDDDHTVSFDDHPPSSVHFPTSRSVSPPSPASPSSTPSSSRPTSPSLQLPRGASTPILLSNGKPLKPSLKSSSSSPAMLIPTHGHLRARSEPSTPKNVHFPEMDYGLATVRVFNCSARPAALSNPANGNGDETETEGEDTPPDHFPFPVFNYEIDPTKSSPVPSKPCPAHLVLESLHLSSPSPAGTQSKPLLTGSILVCNLAFEKHVAIRFTLDDWQTISEVGAYYVDSLPRSPSLLSSSTTEDNTSQRGRGWDRFTFAIRLEDYAPSLSTRTLWLAARYHTKSTYPQPGSSHYGPGGEWWDNNGGGNYRVGFRPAVSATFPRAKPRRETIPAPVSSPCTRPQPPTTCKEHALGLIFPSFPKDDRQPKLQRTGKPNLFNYAPPTVRATPCIPPAIPPSMPLIANTSSSSPPPGSPSDEHSASPASSTLSTPSVSPTIVPRVIIGGQPATSSSEDDNAITTSPTPGHIVDWDWSAPGKPRIGRAPHNDPVPGLEPSKLKADIPLPLGLKGVRKSNSLYDAFVSQWCFAQGPSSSHHAYDGGGIMA